MKRVLGPVVFVAGVALLGVGVPLLWLWIASQLEHSLRGVTGGPLAVMVFGMLGTYLALTVLAGRWEARGQDRPVRRRNWNRSLSAERRAASPTTTMEGLFITATLVVAVAFEVWLFLFAGSSLPSGTG